MSNISDLIERYLKELLAASARGMIEIRRNELAEQFNCVPSQINYVLATRFTTGHGYVVESRRGGGGFIRIVKIPLDERVDLILELCRIIGDSISQADAEGLIRRLRDEELITRREAALMRSVVKRDILRLGLPMRDELRALALKAMITAILKE
ncbi:MAG: CtsR family transcriptional regulator [Firmicutes bacterium]|nr:CtsR family transcriptional regulator [Bacillota bacterium]